LVYSRKGGGKKRRGEFQLLPTTHASRGGELRGKTERGLYSCSMIRFREREETHASYRGFPNAASSKGGKEADVGHAELSEEKWNFVCAGSLVFRRFMAHVRMESVFRGEETTQMSVSIVVRRDRQLTEKGGEGEQSLRSRCLLTCSFSLKEDMEQERRERLRPFLSPIGKKGRKQHYTYRYVK